MSTAKANPVAAMPLSTSHKAETIIIIAQPKLKKKHAHILSLL